MSATLAPTTMDAKAPLPTAAFSGEEGRSVCDSLGHGHIDPCAHLFTYSTYIPEALLHVKMSIRCWKYRYLLDVILPLRNSYSFISPFMHSSNVILTEHLLCPAWELLPLRQII